jgi:hypothetical protein
MNALICSGVGFRRLKVNTHYCPQITEALELQLYDANGQLSKGGTPDYSHAVDALGFLVWGRHPLANTGHIYASGITLY